MNQENLEKIQRKLELITREWWFFLIFLFIQFIPTYTSKGYEWAETGKVVGEILSHAIVFSCTALYPIFKVIPIILIISIIFLGKRVTRLFNFYVAISYILFAFLQNIAVTEKYGLGIVTLNIVMCLIVAAFWIWETVVQKNDFTPQKQPIWKWWAVPFGFLAFWYPANPDTLMPDFNPVYLLTNASGLAFCMMTPVYLAILSLYHPRVNIPTLRVTALVGTIIGFYNMWVNFFINASALWWNGVLHIPLLTISVYGLILSLKKSLVEEVKTREE